MKNRNRAGNQGPGLTLRAWARKDPPAAVRAVLGLILQAAAGAALGGVILFGPLNLGWSAATLLGGLTAGLLLAALTASPIICAVRGFPGRAARWRRAINWGSLLLAATVGLLILSQLYLAGTIPVPLTGRLAEFDRLCRALERHYPYFAEKGIDPGEFRRRYAAAATAGDDAAYFRVVRDMLAELDDAHTTLVAPVPDRRHSLGSVGVIEGKAVVTGVRGDITAPGLQRGAVITGRDGLTVDGYLATLEPWQICGSTERQRQQKGYAALMSAAAGETFALSYLDPGGHSRQARLTGAPPAVPPQRDGAAKGGPGPVIAGKRLDSGIGYLDLPTFSGGGRDLVAEFDRALDRLLDTPALIIDLRVNGGGSTAISDRIAGRFFEVPFVYGREYYTATLPQRGWAREYRYRVTPRGRQYRGPVILLVDLFTMSSAENFVAAMIGSQRALLAGRPTAGSSGNPVRFNLRGGYARYSTGDFRLNDGRPIEGVGFQPHIPVEWTVNEVISGVDPDIAAAELHLLAGVD